MKKFKFKEKVFIGLIIIFLSTESHAEFEIGFKHYQEKNYEMAFKEFLEAAQHGDRDSQNNLGAMYYRGEYVKKDLTDAYAWFALANQQKSHDEKSIDVKIFNKLSTEEKKAAKEKYEKLFNQYSDKAIDTRLTPTFIGKNITAKDYRILKKVIPTYPISMLRNQKSGFVDIVYSIDKNGFTKDHLIYHSTSKKFEQEAAQALRKFQYEPMTVNGKPVNVNGVRMRFNFQITGAEYNNEKITKIVDDLRNKAKTGDSNDKLGFAYFLEVIPSFTKKYPIVDNPNEWYLAAANNGSGAASYFLGRNILYGNLCTQDTNQSMGWLLKSAKLGISDAQYMLAIESFSGVNFEKNEEKAFYWLEKAANSSNKAAKIRYSWILATHPEKQQRNGKLASQYLTEIDGQYYDKQSYYQTLAAVAAENNDFKNAIKWQTQAIEDAKELELPTEIAEKRMISYSNNMPWREEP